MDVTEATTTTEQSADLTSKESVYAMLRKHAEQHPEFEALMIAVGAKYGWKFAGRALAGRPLSELVRD